MPEQNLLQSSNHPPAQPSYILRGHYAQVHAVHFFRGNTRLLTGDANGWVVLWSLSSKRAVAVWKPHTNTILGVNSWGSDKILTHGRDGRIHVWQLREEDEKEYSRILPIDSDDDRDKTSTSHKQPWLLHSLPVNALNFCSFSMLELAKEEENNNIYDLPDRECSIFLGTPGFQDGSINITSLPDEKRIATIPPPGHVPSAGMIMAIELVFSSDGSKTSSTPSQNLLVLGGYESGHACIWRQSPPPSSSSASSTPSTRMLNWQCIYTSKPHSQPILSLGISPATTSKTGASTAFYSSSADAVIARHPLPNSTSSSTTAEEAQTLQTRHAGQQSLKVRSDGKIFATAGWDGRVRVYSAGTTRMNEVAVLKWHKEGCYAVGFADVGGGMDDDGQEKEERKKGQDVEIVNQLTTVSAKREARARTTHWLAAGSKDGKVSLWDIY